MNKTERLELIRTYSKQYGHYLIFKDEQEKLRLQGQRDIMKIFFTPKEIKTFENHERVKNVNDRVYFVNLESWVKQVNKEYNEPEMLFDWTREGVIRVENTYDWLLTEEKYKGFALAIEDTLERLEKMESK